MNLGNVFQGWASRVNAGWASVRSRPRSAFSVGLVGVVSVGLLVAMFLADGFRPTSYELQDASVWVTNASRSKLGRINTQVLKQDESFQMDADTSQTKDLDVAQDGRTVLMLQPAAGEGAALDVVNITAGKALKIPANSKVGMAGGTVLVAADGNAWASPAESFSGVTGGKDGTKPTLRLGAGGVAAVGVDGSVAGYAPLTGRLAVVRQRGDRRTTTIDKGIAEPQITMVGGRAVVFDPAGPRLVLDDGSSIDLPDTAKGAQLQQRGDDPSHVLLASAAGVLVVPTGGGRVEVGRGSAELAGGGTPVEPVRVGGCSYAAWSGANTFWSQCGSGDPVVAKLDIVAAGAGSAAERRGGLTGDMRFRINRTKVVLNLIETGATFVVNSDRKVQQVDDWGAQTENTTTTDPDKNDNPIKELKKEQEPPTANGDEFGAREGRQTLLGVLDNDTDPNGDPLSITDLGFGGQGDGVTLRLDDGSVLAVVQGGQAVAVTPGPDAGGTTIPFSYGISDGRGGTARANVQVQVVSSGAPNRKPELKKLPDGSDRDSAMELRLGATGTYDVLQDWIDPDGDPLVLQAASLQVPSDVDQVTSSPDGSVTFTDGGIQAGLKQVVTQVADVVPDGTSEVADGTLDVNVRGESEGIPPVARPDYVTTGRGVRVVVQPLVNDSSGTGKPLRLTTVNPPVAAPDGAQPEISRNEADNSVAFRADTPGDYVFTYRISDSGSQEVEGAIRVRVVEAAGNASPAAGPDLVVVPLGGSRSVDLLVNDYDPNGDVLAVDFLEESPTPKLKASLIDHRRVRVHLEQPLDAPVPLTYQLTDGANPPVGGQLVIVMAPPGAGNEAPRAADDAIVVLAGDVATIPVLANDVDPDGDPLTLQPTLVDAPTGGGAMAAVSGGNVKFRAPDTAGFVEFSYEVQDPDGRGDTARVVVDVRDPTTAQRTPPTPPALEARVYQGGTVKITVPLVGADPDGDSVALEGLYDAPSQGLVKTPVTGDTIEYRAFEDASGGTDTFHYRVRDRRGDTGIGIIRVAVLPRTRPNQDPVALEDHLRARPNSTVLVPVLANDFDPDGDVVSLDAEQAPVVGGGVTAQVVGNRLSIGVPGGTSAMPVRYFITDPKGGTASGYVTIEVTPDATPVPPVARDDTDIRPVGADETERKLPVTDNDDDPDGDPRALKVEIVDPKPEWASVEPAPSSDEGAQVVVQLGAAPRVLAYRVTDVDGQSAVAFVRVPARDAKVNQPPKQIGNDRLPIEVEPGKPTTILLKEFVEDEDGPNEVRLTAVDRVSATRSALDSEQMVTGPKELQFRAQDGFSGEASITFEVTDGRDNTVISLPILVRGSGNQPPRATGQPIAVVVAPGEPATQADLREYFVDTDRKKDSEGKLGPEDRETLKFTDLSSAPAGIKELRIVDGHLLQVQAADDAEPGKPTKITFRVSDGTNDPVPAEATIRVEQSRRDLIKAGEDQVTVEVGKSVSVPVTDNDLNPFEDGELKVTAVDARGLDSVSQDGNKVVVAPRKGMQGDWTVAYTVVDKTGDRDRAVQGLVKVKVRDVPDKPLPPKVDEVASKRVVLSWVEPAPNGSTISGYELSWGGQSKSCPSTTCEVTGLTNAQTYTFTVVAINEVGRSDPSPASAPARPDQKPDRPTAPKLEFRPKTDGTLYASWPAATADGSAIKEYRLRITPAPPAGLSEISAGTALEQELSGLENGTSYTVQLIAVNDAGDSEPSAPSNAEWPAKVPGQVAAAPAFSRIDDPLGAQVRVGWSAPADTGGAKLDQLEYDLVWYTGSSSKVVVVKPGDPARPIDPAKPSVLLGAGDGVQNGVAYSFAVRTRNKADTGTESAKSNPEKTWASPGPLSGATATDGNKQATIAVSVPTNAGWDGGRAIERYEVQLTRKDNGQQLPVVSFPVGGGTNLKVTNLLNGVKYAAKVRACNAAQTADTKYPCALQWTDVSNEIWPYGPLVGGPTINYSLSGTTANFSWSLPDLNQSGTTLTNVTVCLTNQGCFDARSSNSRSVDYGMEASFSGSISVTDNRGQTGSDSKNGNTPSWPRDGSATWGTAVSVNGCTNNCRRMVISIRGWVPGVTAQVTCEYNYNRGAGWGTDFGWDPPDLVPNGSGNADGGDGGNNCVGSPTSGWSYRFRVSQNGQTRYFQVG